MPTDGTHTCPCGCNRQVSHRRYACLSGWQRLPRDVRDAIRDADNRRDLAAKGNAMARARRWYADNPRWKPPTREEMLAAAAISLTSMAEVLTGVGEHAQHQRRQIGRCVHCSCGARVQGRMTEAPDE